ncbi:hypothetical protein TNCT_409851 [Trichonephila clavata]|uniref:Uncharacterized protein n=1 Tax=Trichonephila clavata TaxID=2740835 RepID=A0A8X6GXB4_TRICU|nr:hypothetical protein TNCT_409851 [Trichonephila clavata]
MKMSIKNEKGTEQPSERPRLSRDWPDRKLLQVRNPFDFSGVVGFPYVWIHLYANAVDFSTPTTGKIPDSQG